MKTSRKLIAGIVVVLVLFGTAALALCRLYTQQQDDLRERLTAAGNCQTDVIAPFLQAAKLGHIKPTEGQDFSAFLAAQVQSGAISEQLAKQTIAAIESAGQGLPVYTARGWVMPVIAANSSK